MKTVIDLKTSETAKIRQKYSIIKDESKEDGCQNKNSRASKSFEQLATIFSEYQW